MADKDLKHQLDRFEKAASFFSQNKYHLKSQPYDDDTTDTGSGLLADLFFEIMEEKGYGLTDRRKKELLNDKASDLLRVLGAIRNQEFLYVRAKERNKDEAQGKGGLDLDKENYSKAEAARILGVSPPTVKNWLRSDKVNFRSVQVDGKEGVPKEELLRMYKRLNEDRPSNS